MSHSTKPFVSSVPELLKQWDFSKNKNYNPDEITIGSGLKIWWICDKGHSYQSTVNNRIRGDGCPYCSNKKILAGYNDLATLAPELASQWDSNKNSILPSEVGTGSAKKVWWICKKNHSFQAAINERTGHDKTGCPYCSNRKILKGFNDLETLFPELAKEWDYSKNKDLKPCDFGSASNQKIHWKCQAGHSYTLEINKRSHGQNCPICSQRRLFTGQNDLATLYPVLSKEWDYEKNSPLTPDKITPASTKRVFWICSACGYKWSVPVRNRAKYGSGCPNCSLAKRGLKKQKTSAKANTFNNSELLKDWDYEANSPNQPSDYSSKSNKKVHWKCHICGNVWQESIAARMNGNGCRVCSNRKIIPGLNDLATTDPEIASQWHPTRNRDLKPTQFSRGNGKRVWWICKKGHSYQATILSRTSKNKKGNDCPICNAGTQTSFAEQAIYYYVKKQFPDAINRYKPDFLGKMELDIYIPSIQWAIEYDGRAWHTAKTREREIKKYKLCKEHGIRLYRIKESPIENYDFQTYDKALHTEKIWLKDKLSQAIKFLLQDFFMWIPGHIVDVDVERDRFEISKYLDRIVEGSLAELYPDIAKEWHPTKNGSLKPDMFRPGSNEKIWWICPDCGKEYESSIVHRKDGGGCPKCALERFTHSRIKKVARINLATNEVEKVYDSITEAAKDVGLKSSSNITSVCKGKKPSIAGFGWKYVD